MSQPEVFGSAENVLCPVCGQQSLPQGASKLVRAVACQNPSCRIIIEKPYGHQIPNRQD